MLLKKLSNKNVILASKSPRRQQFLTDLRIPFQIKIKEIEEIYPENLQEEEITDYLSQLKAAPFTKELAINDILITSDTIVWLKDQAFGKPNDNVEAITMLQTLSGQTHKVITSVSLTSKEKQITFSDTTLVSFKELTTDEIEYYVATFSPLDKAGSYGIQEWIGFIGVTKLEGSYFNVMGLPVHKLYEELLKF